MRPLRFLLVLVLMLSTLLTPEFHQATADSSNLIINGAFSSGNQGFTSDYVYSPLGLGDPATYTVGTNPSVSNPAWANFGDHNTTNGNMLVVNGSTSSSPLHVWSETVAVAPGTRYQFSMWVASTYPDPAALQLYINGTQQGQVFTAPSQIGTWASDTVGWLSGTSSTAQISIVDTNTNFSGNDFALDDLSFEQGGSTLADSVQDFSATQGQNNWSYGYYPNPPATKFIPMTQFVPNVNPTYGSIWYEDPANYWTQVWANGGHPNGAITSGGRQPVEQWSVRRWVSTTTGTLTLKGHVAKLDLGGDGTTTHIIVDGSEVWSHFLDGSDATGTDYTVNIQVRNGSDVDFAISPGANDYTDATKFTASIASSATVAQDSDHDGISDATEQQLAEKFAPTLLLDPSEPNYPIGVDSFLSLSSQPSLKYFEQCFPAPKSSNLTAQAGPLTQANLLTHAVVTQSCGRSTSWSPITSIQSDPLTNYGGGQPNEAFYLSTVPRGETVGSLDPAHWITYYHAYPAFDGGIMIQYWHFFTANDWQNGGGPNFDGHFGDWDASIQVHLGSDLNIERIWYSRHEHDAPGDPMTNIVYLQGTTPPSTNTNVNTAYIINGSHPLVMVDSGGHAAFASPADTCSYWNGASAGKNGNAFGKQVWGDPSHPASLAEVSCSPKRSAIPTFQPNIGGTIWDNRSGGSVAQISSNIAVHLTTSNPGGPLRNLGEYNPGNMGTCSTCAGLDPGNTSFYPDAAGVFTGYSGLWGSPNLEDRWGFGYPPRGPVFQGYNGRGVYLSWYNEASDSPFSQ